MSQKIFISYRRDDSSDISGRIHDRLRTQFPQSKIFIDVNTIPPGVDYIDALESEVSTCDMLLAIIGPKWLSAEGLEKGSRRLDDPTDLVRIEIIAALSRAIRVIPVLVGSAQIPTSAQLPEALKSLARRNAITVSHSTFDSDMARLTASFGAIQTKRKHAYKSYLTIFGALAIAGSLNLTYPSEIGRRFSAAWDFVSLGFGHPKPPVRQLLPGLAQIATHSGPTLIMYAASSGKLAAAGDENGSTFSRSVSQHLADDALDVEQLAKRVIADVKLQTEVTQLPIYESTLDQPINLKSFPGPKFALVIGNGDYENVTVLSAPAKDAELVSRRLGKLGFQVSIALDADYLQMKNTITNFLDRLRREGKGGIAVFYYSGHGVQVDGVNYAIPVDVKLETVDDLTIEGVGVQEIVDGLQTSGIAATIVFLDTCRDNPFKNDEPR